MREKSKRLVCNISIFLIIAFAIAVVVIPKPIGNLDELWNFNFANNVEKVLYHIEILIWYKHLYSND